MRKDNLSWEEMFFGVCFWAAMRSKDPSTQCGATIIRDNKVLGFGYNGFINGIKDTEEKWGKDEKIKYIYHAEENAIRNCLTNDFINAHLYLWTSREEIYLPCDRCARTIAHYGIKHVHVLRGDDLSERNSRWNPAWTIDIFNECGIEIHYYDRDLINDKIANRNDYIYEKIDKRKSIS